MPARIAVALALVPFVDRLLGDNTRRQEEEREREAEVAEVAEAASLRGDEM